MTIDRKAHEQNRKTWNEATRLHRRHRPHQAAFFRDGGSTLYDEELQLLGEVGQKRLVHLQCNAGQDSISLANLGARVTGVDISDTAIAEARDVSREAGISVTFERADVYEWLDQASASGQRFERALASYGAICWLSDLEAWAQGIASVLEPGGVFVLVDYHPVAVCYDEQFELAYDWAKQTPYRFEDGVGDYVGQSGEALAPGGFEPAPDEDNPHACIEYPWTLADVLQAVLSAGLRLETFHEWPYSNGYRMYEKLVPIDERRWGFPQGEPRLPLMFGLRAKKPERGMQ